MPRLARRRLPILALLAAISLLAGGCSAPGTSSINDETEPIDVEEGRQLFQSTCRVCHSLGDANAAGTFGPDLDQLQPDAERVREQIDSGGGGMPSFEGKFSDEEADLLARYVAQVAGTGPPPEEQSGGRGATKPAATTP